MTRIITGLRSLSVAMACICLAACAAGQKAIDDPCAKVRADGRAIMAQSVDQTIKGRAIAEHVVDHADCYESDLVATARTGLVQMDQPTPPPPTWMNQVGR